MIEISRSMTFPIINKPSLPVEDFVVNKFYTFFFFFIPCFLAHPLLPQTWRCIKISDRQCTEPLFYFYPSSISPVHPAVRYYQRHF